MARARLRAARQAEAERAGIIVVTLGVLLLIWQLADSLARRVALTALVVICGPALVVLTLDRRT